MIELVVQAPKAAKRVLKRITESQQQQLLVGAVHGAELFGISAQRQPVDAFRGGQIVELVDIEPDSRAGLQVALATNDEVFTETRDPPVAGMREPVCIGERTGILRGDILRDRPETVRHEPVCPRAASGKPDLFCGGGFRGGCKLPAQACSQPGSKAQAQAQRPVAFGNGQLAVLESGQYLEQPVRPARQVIVVKAREPGFEGRCGAGARRILPYRIHTLDSICLHCVAPSSRPGIPGSIVLRGPSPGIDRYSVHEGRRSVICDYRSVPEESSVSRSRLNSSSSSLADSRARYIIRSSSVCES